MSSIQTLVFDSAKNPEANGYVEGFSGNGLWSLAVVYTVKTVANIVTPTISAFLHHRLVLLIGGLTFVFFTSQLVILNTYALYLAAALAGVGNAMIWNVQGVYVANNSTQKTISMHFGLFSGICCTGGLLGNAFVYFKFAGVEIINSEVRLHVGLILICLASTGTIMSLFLPHKPKKKELQISIRAMIKSFGKLFITKNMLLLCCTAFYSGTLLNIGLAVLPTCIGFNLGFGDQRKGLANVSGMLVSIGQVLSGVIFGIFGRKLDKYGRSSILILACVLILICYITILISFPKESIFGETSENHSSIIESNIYIVVCTSFCIGISTICVQVQVNSLFGTVFKQELSTAFAIYSFIQAVGVSVSFWYEPWLNLYWQLAIAAFVAVLGTATFCVVAIPVHRMMKSTDKNEERKDTASKMSETHISDVLRLGTATFCVVAIPVHRMMKSTDENEERKDTALKMSETHTSDVLPIK